MNKECLALCLYDGPNEPLDLAEESMRHIHLMDQLGIPVSHMGLGGNRSSGKLMGKKAAFNRLAKAATGDYDSVSLVSCPPGSEGPAFDWEVYVEVSQVPVVGRTRSLACESPLITRLSDSLFLDELLNSEVYSYGFSLTMRKEDCPEIYLLAGPTDDEHSRTASRLWQNFSFKQEPIGDRIRDIYPVNYLNERHLALPVGSSTFKDVLMAHGATSTRRIAGLAEYVLPSGSLSTVREIMRTTGHVISLPPVA
jgi:hypothetical protein